MSSRHLASFGVLVVVIAVESLAPVRLAGQAPAAAAQKPAATRTWAEPRTPGWKFVDQVSPRESASSGASAKYKLP